MYELHEECLTGVIVPEKMESILQVNNVWQSFKQNDGQMLHVLTDFNLDIANLKNKPQIVSILGQSGSGKTTALRIIAGLDKPTQGEVLLTNGKKDIGYKMCPVEAGQIGVVFQKYPLFEESTVFQILVDPAIKNGMSRKDAEINALNYLSQFNLLAQRDQWPVQLSGGQRQRVAILQQLMVPHRHFLILDEPFSGLDSQSIGTVIKLLNTIALTHTLNTFIIVTHDVTSALIIADHIYLIGKPAPNIGAKVMYEFDLISEGLAYHENIEDIPRFNEIRKSIKYDLMPRL